MTIDSTIAFRKLISDSLQYMWTNLESKQDNLAMLERLEKAAARLINHEAGIFLRGVVARYEMNVANRVEFGVMMLEGLKFMMAPERKPEHILLVLDKLQAWIQREIDREVTRMAGKPSLSYQRIDKNNKLGKDNRIN